MQPSSHGERRRASLAMATGLSSLDDQLVARVGHREEASAEDVAVAQKLAAKNASDNSQRLYFSLLLKDAPAPATGLVMSVNGPKWFDIFVLEFGLEARVWVEDMRGVEGAFDPDRRVLTLRPAAGAGPGEPSSAVLTTAVTAPLAPPPTHARRLATHAAVSASVG